MKKVFTLVLAMTMVITSFAQIKSSRKSVKFQPAQMIELTGMEERDDAGLPVSERTMLDINPEITELSYTTYDWQSNMAARNFTAVWPDGFAVMCYTQASDNTYSDRGTGLAIWDPEVGEWEYTENRVEGIKTGFGSIARYKENGLVIAAHTSTDCRIFIVEDFREGNRDFGTGITMPTEGEDGRTQDMAWPAVQCSGPNNDIIHVLTTESNDAVLTPYKNALLYSRYENGEWTVKNHIIPNVGRDFVSDGGSNIAYFMLYDPARPNRVSFILNNAWSDGKLVISEDNGETWTDRVFFQHPGINETYATSFYYPRWTGAAFDANDNLHIAYEWNGSTGEPGSGSYYPGLGGIAYWSEVLPKNEMCIGGIGEVGGPFILDTTYLSKDLYESEWYWSDANHEPLPEYMGELEIIDEYGNVLPRDGGGANYYWVDNSTWSDHGSYNGGKAAFASLYFDKPTNTAYAFWSMIAGDEETMYWDSDNAQHYLRIFCNVSANGGRTWEGTKQVVTDFMNQFDEMVYGQVIPYLYTDDEGDYLWYCYQLDGNTGTYVQGDETNPDDNLYAAVKVYVNYMWDDVEDNNVEAPTTMKVYPNPANGTFTMELNQESDVNIYNVAGQLVKTYKSVKNLNVNLEAGVYFVQAGNQTQKVVVL